VFLFDKEEDRERMDYSISFFSMRDTLKGVKREEASRTYIYSFSHSKLNYLFDF